MLPLSFREFCLFQAVEGDRLKGPGVLASNPDLPRGTVRPLSDRGRFSWSAESPQRGSHRAFAELCARCRSPRRGRTLGPRGHPDRQPIRPVRPAQHGLRVLRQPTRRKPSRSSDSRSIGEKADRIMDLLRQAFLLMKVEEHAFALKPQTTATPKVYGIDPGIVYAVSRANQQDVGKRFETAVYLVTDAGAWRASAPNRSPPAHCTGAPGTEGGLPPRRCSRRRARRPHPGDGVHGVPAHPRTGGGFPRCRHGSDGDIKEGTIVTLREEERIETEAGPIEVVPACKWFLR